MSSNPFSATGSPAPEDLRWYHRPWVVLGLLFFVLGPFGLPLVYKSPKFNRLWKWVLTGLMIFYSIWLVGVTIEAVKKVSATYGELRTALGI